MAPSRPGTTLAAVLVLVLSAAAQEPTVGEVFATGEESHWLVEQGGEPLGHCWSRYEGPVDLAGTRAHRFRSQVRFRVEVPGGALDQRFTAELWTDSAGHPLRLDFRAKVTDAFAGVEIAFAGAQSEATVHQGPFARTQPVEAPEEGFVLANNFLSHLELVLALRAPAPGESTSFAMFSVNRLLEFPLVVEHVEEDELDGFGAVSVYRDSLGEVLRVDREGRLVELEAGGAVFRRTGTTPELFTIEPPRAPATADLDAEDVVIEHGEVSLAGTITRPKGSTGRLPAVFFVSGSGVQDRQGFSNGIDVGTHEILDRLTEEGFLVLRVDDRGAGQSRGPTDGMDFDDLVEDARRCVAYVRARSDVDPERIALIGHSEGAMTASILAAEGDAVAAVVLMAGPGRSLLELVHEQLVRGKRLEGATEEELEKFEAQVRTFLESVAAGESVDPSGLPPELALLAAAGPWMTSHVRQDPTQDVARVRCPILILQGARDIQVSAERDTPRLVAALEEAGHPDHEVVVFPELDHLFKRTEEVEPTGLDYLKSRPVDGEFLDVLSAWLEARLARGGD